MSWPPSLPDLFGAAIGFANAVAFPLAPIALVLMIIYAGYIRLTAGDNPGNLAKSNSTLLWAVLGTVAIYGAILLVRLAAQVAGAPGLNPTDINFTP